MLKRIISIFSISLIITGSFFSVYNIKYPVYADSNTDGWTQVTTNQQLVEAFKYYCKSRDLTIEGSIADGVTSFTTQSFNGICNTLGIDITALQAEIKYQTDGNTGLKFLFSAMGINAFNRIFAQFLQDNDLSVGDSADQNNNTVYSGITFLDYYDNVILCTVTNSYNSSTAGVTNMYSISPSDITLGSAVGGMDPGYFKQFLNTGNNKVARYYMAYTSSDNSTTNNYAITYYSNANAVWEGDDFYNSSGTKYGFVAIVYRPADNGFRLTKVFYDVSKGKYATNPYNYSQKIYPKNNQSSNCTIYLTTNNTVINNNVYEGDTIINNEGDVTNNNYPDPNPNPTPDPPTIPDSGGWQDFSLPDMPNDWLIYGMEKKFPFDIPFNILFALSLLNHEPEIPKFEGDIDLQVCTWHYDIDLTPFDDIATILRKFEVLGFIIGLAILTKNLINWG